MIRGRFATGRRSSAFTLIEIMVAVVIFAIMMTALFASFRTGMKAYSMGTEHTNQQQLGRYAVNQVARDLRNIYYKPESQYNVARRQQEAMLDASEDGLEQGAAGDVVDENLPDLGPPIDLSFTGQDGGDIDQLSLVRRLGFNPSDASPLWGLGRITYYVIDGNLYRAIDDITRPETDEDGNIIPKATSPQIDKLAENCVGFDLKYGYYYDENWDLADYWDSKSAQFRNPPEEDEDEEFGVSSSVGTNVNEDVDSKGAAGALQSQVEQQDTMERSDDLPGWVEVTFAFAEDPENPEIKRVYKQTIMMSSKYAVETYVPEDEDDDVLKGARSTAKSLSRDDDR